jgi:hypothetical protein
MASEVDTIAWAIKALRDPDRLLGYALARRYYDGEHSLTFATEKFKSVFGRLFNALADNLCPAVVDSVADRLKVTGVEAGQGVDDAVATAAWTIWQRNRMDVRAPETHHEALLSGDGYALVWPDASDKAVIWPLAAADVAVSYDPNRPGVIRRAARVWQDDDDQRVHVDLFFADRVERYVTRGARRRILGASTRPGDFVPYFTTDGRGAQVEDVIEYGWGRVPIVHFPNRRYHAYGISELANVLPLQDALNKTLCDMLIAQEFSAFPQRWATGIEVGEVDEQGRASTPPYNYGNDRMFTTAEEAAKFGAFPTSDLRMYVEVQENLRSEIARVSGTPLHYLFITRGDFPSGEAMKSAEARFTRKVEQRQAAFGNQWEDLLALALRIEGVADVDGDALSLAWESASPTAGDAVAPDDSRARSAAQPGGREEPPIGEPV